MALWATAEIRNPDYMHAFFYFKPDVSESLQFFKFLYSGGFKGSRFVLSVNLEMFLYFLWKSCDKATVAPPHPAEFVTDATKNNK